MYANLKPVSLMGVPCKIASSEKDLHATTRKRDFIDCEQETLVLISDAGKKSVVPNIRLPPRGVGGGDHGDAGGEEDHGGCTTPKAAGKGESELPKCPPPPPRKPKSVPSTRRKRPRALLDLSSEIESLFPSNILRDFMCGKIKKVRTGCPQIL